MRRWTSCLRCVKGLGLEEVLGEVEGAPHEHAVAGADRADGDRGGDVALAHARGADQEQVLVLGDEACRSQLHDLGLGELGIEGPVEVLELLDLDDLALLEPSGEEPVRSAVQLVLDEELEEFEVRQGRGLGLGEADGERLGHAGQAQVLELADQGRVHRFSSR